MGDRGYQNKSSRHKAVAGVVFIHALIGYGFWAGMGVDVARRVGDSLNVVRLSVEPPVPVNPKPKQAVPNVKPERKEAEAAAPNRKAEPTAIVAPPPLIVIPTINPTVAAPLAGEGIAGKAGAALEKGPGTGAAGLGNGKGSGQNGDGTGGGGIAVKSRLKSGRITRRDYPPAAKQAKAGGSVVVQYTVNANGRVSQCRIKRSSGRSDLDATTCRLIEQRFRYEPARDRNGRAVDHITGWQQDWWLERGGQRVTD
jgi:protein TonB